MATALYYTIEMQKAIDELWWSGEKIVLMEDSENENRKQSFSGSLAPDSRGGRGVGLKAAVM